MQRRADKPETHLRVDMYLGRNIDQVTHADRAAILGEMQADQAFTLEPLHLAFEQRLGLGLPRGRRDRGSGVLAKGR